MFPGFHPSVHASVRHTLCAAPSKIYDFSTNYHACIAMFTWCRCTPPILHDLGLHLASSQVMFNTEFLHQSSLMGNTLYATSNAMPCQQIIMHLLRFPHDVDVHRLFCFDIDLHLTCSRQGHVSHGFYLLIFTDVHHFVCSAHQKVWFSTNNHVCIAMSTWCRCAPYIYVYLDLHLTSSEDHV